MGYDFTGGRIFDFPIDFSIGLTTVQRYCAACDALNDSGCQIPVVSTRLFDWCGENAIGSYHACDATQAAVGWKSGS